MANKMLIDATHPEETRVVVLRGNRVEEFDFESAHRKQLRGNIYLAKVTRVEPSLQAAFVDYGGNRHGFLAFSEIHPDYYQIPVADRQALIEEEQRAHRAADDEIDRRSRHRGRSRHSEARRQDEFVRGDVPEDEAGDSHAAEHGSSGAEQAIQSDEAEHGSDLGFTPSAVPVADATEAPEQHDASEAGPPPLPSEHTPHEAIASDAPFPIPDPVPGGDLPIADPAAADTTVAPEAAPFESTADHESEAAVDGSEAPLAHSGAEDRSDNGDSEDAENGENGEDIVESVGGADALEEVPDRAPRYRRQYKIQEVIKRRQVMLVQVVKEERGTKGAALTTYLSLAGRYSVLMPNTARGGGISRKNSKCRKGWG